MAIAIAFGLAWLVVFIAGADHPPPFGFIGLLPVLALSSAFGSLSSIVVDFLSGGHESGTPPSGRSGGA